MSKYWEWCDLCTAVRTEKLSVHPGLPSKRMSDLVLLHWGGLLFEQAHPRALIPSHHPDSPTPDGVLAKNTMQGGHRGPDPLIPAGLTGIKRVCKDPKLRLKVHLQMRQLRDTLWCWLPSLHSCLICSLQGVRFLSANLRRKAFLIQYLTDSEYVYFYTVNKIWILSSLGRDFVFWDLFKALSLLLVLQV